MSTPCETELRYRVDFTRIVPLYPMTYSGKGIPSHRLVILLVNYRRHSCKFTKRFQHPMGGQYQPHEDPFMKSQLVGVVEVGRSEGIVPPTETKSTGSGFHGAILTRIIHEHFCSNRRSAAPTGLRPAGSPLGPSPYCTSTHRGLRAPRAGLATRLSDFATNCHE
jgi:hypothetical protein